MANLRNTKITDSGFLEIPAGSTEDRPDNPEPGMIRYNTSLQNAEWYTGTEWQKIVLGLEDQPINFPQGITVGPGSVTNGIIEQNGSLQVNTNGTSQLRLDDVGRMRVFNQPVFAVSRSQGNQTATSTITYDHSWINIGGHMNLSTGRFTAPISGFYYLTHYSIVGNDSNRVNMYLYINDSNTHRYRDDTRNGRWQTISFATIQYLNESDFVDLRVVSGQAYGNNRFWNRFSGWLMY